MIGNYQLFDPKQSESFLAMAERALIDRDPESGKKLVGCFQNFIKAPIEDGRRLLHAGLQNFTTKGDLPDVVTNMPSVFTNTDNFDLGFEMAFQEVPTDPGRLDFEIATLDDTISFALMAEGQSAAIGSASGDKVTVTCHRYSAALGWTYEMIRGRRLSAMVQMAEMARVRYNLGRANRFYSLLAAGSGNTVTYGTTADTDDVEVKKDINTLNTAAYTVANATKDSGYGDTANAQMLLFISPRMKGRINRALRWSNQEYLGSNPAVQWPIMPVYTFNPNIAGVYTSGLLVLPGRKLQRSMPVPLMTMEREEYLSMTYVQAFHYFEGGAVADPNQVALTQFA